MIAMRRSRRSRQRGSGGVDGFLAACFCASNLCLATLREIFDESAYQRFLDRSQQQNSVNAYAAFRLENEEAKSRIPKCC